MHLLIIAQVAGHDHAHGLVSRERRRRLLQNKRNSRIHRSPFIHSSSYHFTDRVASTVFTRAVLRIVYLVVVVPVLVPDVAADVPGELHLDAGRVHGVDDLEVRKLGDADTLVTPAPDSRKFPRE